MNITQYAVHLSKEKTNGGTGKNKNKNNLILVFILFRIKYRLYPIFNKGCSPGNFGIDCKRICSGNCMSNEPCDHVSGGCKSGCQDGYFGKLCIDGKRSKLPILYKLN